MKKTNSFRSGLFFGIAMTVFFILRNLFIHDHQTTKEVIKAVASGLVAGVISGLLFGWLTGLFGKSKGDRQNSP